MKKLTHIIALLFCLAGFAQREARTPIQATFGRYGADCSAGRGICSFALSKSETGKYSMKNSENTILLSINNTALAADEQIKIAGKLFNSIKENEKPVFIQEESIRLDSISLENLNINGKFKIIPAGNYPMKITKEQIEIVLTLKTTD
ncbi:MAG TPA: hypothetical protein VK623_10195 [Flavobacterium sp.]|nr:hypothetical protein [Flavobacterium sp.]